MRNKSRQIHKNEQQGKLSIIFVNESRLLDFSEVRKLSAREATCNAQPPKEVWIGGQRYGRGIECGAESRRLGCKFI